MSLPLLSQETFRQCFTGLDSSRNPAIDISNTESLRRGFKPLLNIADESFFHFANGQRI